MATPDVQGTIIPPSGTVPAGTKVRLRLVASESGDAEAFGWTDGGDAVGGTSWARPNKAGLYTFPDVNPIAVDPDNPVSTDSIVSPVGAVYQVLVVFPDGTEINDYHLVPDEAGPVVLGLDTVTTAPADLPPAGATNARLGGVLSGTVGAATYVADSVTTAALAPDAVTPTELADDAVTAPAIATNAVTADAIAAGAVGATELATAAATTPKIADAAVTEAKAAARIVDQLTNQTRLLTRLRAGLAVMATERVDILLPNDSMTQPWGEESGGVVSSWLEKLVDQFRQWGPVTADWRPAGRTFSGTWTTTGSYSTGGSFTVTHGYGANGVTLDPGEYWEDTFGGETNNPGDAAAVYVTQQATGGANVRVLVDGVEVLAATSTTNATPSAILGMHKVYESALLDGDEHTIRVEASGSGTVKLDGILVHHGTLTEGLILWNGSLSGSDVGDHVTFGGLGDHLERLVAADTLAAVVLASGLITWDASHTTGAEWTTAADALATLLDDAESLASLITVCQYEPAGFPTPSDRWDGWADTMPSLIRLWAEAHSAAFIDLTLAIPTRANQAGGAVASNGVDYFTWGTTITGLTIDYLHTNDRAQQVIADEIWKVLGQGIGPRDVLATAAGLDAVKDGTDRFELPGGGFVAFEDFDSPFPNVPTIKLGQTANAYESFRITQSGVATVNTSSGATIATTTWATLMDADLAALAGLTSAADRLPYFTGSGTAALATFTSAARNLLDDDDTSAMRTTLGLAIGTNVQAYDAELAALAGLTSAADRVPYFTGSGTAALGTFTSYGRSLVASADRAALMSTLTLTMADIAAGTFSPGGGGTVVWSNFGTIPITGWRLSGDTADRMQITGAGWTIGDGSAAGDVTFNRSSAATGTLTGNLVIAGNLTLSARNIITDTTTGLKIGTGTTQKLGFYNTTPVAQYATTGTSTGFTAGGGTTATHLSTFTGNTGSTAYTVGDVVRCLKLNGLMAA